MGTFRLNNFSLGNRKKGGGLKVFIPQLDEITIESRTPRARKATVWRAGARKPRERAIPRNKFHHKAPLSEGVKNSKTKEPPSNKGQHKTYTRVCFLCLMWLLSTYGSGNSVQEAPNGCTFTWYEMSCNWVGHSSSRFTSRSKFYRPSSGTHLPPWICWSGVFLHCVVVLSYSPPARRLKMSGIKRHWRSSKPTRLPTSPTMRC